MSKLCLTVFERPGRPSVKHARGPSELLGKLWSAKPTCIQKISSQIEAVAFVNLLLHLFTWQLAHVVHTEDV